MKRLDTTPGKRYTILLKDGRLFRNAVRSRNVWNDAYTGRFLAYDQNVKGANLALDEFLKQGVEANGKR